MRDWRQGQGAAAWLAKVIETIVLAGLAGYCGFAGPVAAADLGAGPSAPPPPVAAHPNCRLVPVPHTNLNGYDVVGFPPSWICVSRGVFADRLPPPPPPPPRPWFWW